MKSQILLLKKFVGRLVGSVGGATLDLGRVLTSSPALGIEITFFKKKFIYLPFFFLKALSLRFLVTVAVFGSSAFSVQKYLWWAWELYAAQV